MSPDLEKHLTELGVIRRPVSVPAPTPETPRPDGHHSTWKGTWYPDGEIPH